MYYPEFILLQGQCRFDGCLHVREPQCCVKQAVEAGKISEGRYERYLKLLQETHREERKQICLIMD